jgi:hypothetical protein
MAFNFKNYTANNPLLEDLENIDQYAEDGQYANEEVTVSSSGVEMGQSQYPRIEFEDAVRKALQAGIDKDTLHKIIDWN